MKRLRAADGTPMSTKWGTPAGTPAAISADATPLASSAPSDGSFFASVLSQLEQQPREASAPSAPTPRVPSVLLPAVAQVDLNKLAAQAVKAQLRGDQKLYNEIQAQIAAASASAALHVLPDVDASGKLLAKSAMLTEHEKAVHDQKAKQKRVEGFGKDQYFKDDDSSLQQMLMRDKIRGPMDMDANLAASIVSSQKFKVFNEDDEYGQERGGGFEHMLRAYESKDSKQSVMQVQQRERARQMSEMQKLNATESNCHYCRQSPKFLGHMVVATGTTCYLALHARAIVDGHCFIAPIDHVVSGSSFDETTADEVRNFKKSLIQMFASIGKDCIFYETVMHIKRNPHTCIECVPVAKRRVNPVIVARSLLRTCALYSHLLREATVAPGYFKKAISEHGSEWSTHPKIIDMKVPVVHVFVGKHAS
jgi:hypothetical protein